MAVERMGFPRPALPSPCTRARTQAAGDNRTVLLQLTQLLVLLRRGPRFVLAYFVEPITV